MARSNYQHALHNEGVCNYLNAKGDCPDWVTTTAFYSALHFVTYFLFPFTSDQGEDYDTFDEYKNDCDGNNSHSILRELVRKYMDKECHVAYRQLLDMSYNSRYRSYKVPQEEAKKALVYLSIVKHHCDKKKIPSGVKAPTTGRASRKRIRK